MKKPVVFDIETNGLLWPTKANGVVSDRLDRMHCAVAKVIGEDGWFTTDSPRELLKWLEEHASCIVGHNIIGFDLPALEALVDGFSFTVGPDTFGAERLPIFDTLVASRIYCPWKQGQGLESWGTFLNIEKPKIDDWENLKLSDYIHRCTEDVKINEKLIFFLKEQKAKYPGLASNKAYNVEAKVQYLLWRQPGYTLDIKNAEECVAYLDASLSYLKDKINPILPDRPMNKGELQKVKPPTTACKLKLDGSPTAKAQEFWGDRLVYLNEFVKAGHCKGWFITKGEGYIPLEKAQDLYPTTVKMTADDAGAIKDWLVKEKGWDPLFYNTDKFGEQTTPKMRDASGVTCPNLTKLELPWLEDYLLYACLKHRRQTIKSCKNEDTGWLNNPRLQIDGRLTCDAVPNGTATARFTHKGVANVPRVSSEFGREMRSLLGPGEGYYQVGWDADGLEARVEAHYTYNFDGGEYAAQLVAEKPNDLHTINAGKWQIERDLAKAVKYAAGYGASGNKLASMLGVSKQAGAAFFKQFWTDAWPLDYYRRQLITQWHKNSKKYIIGPDGRPIYTKSEHSVLNFMFQHTGALAMKWAMCKAYDEINKRGLDAQGLIRYHDEEQWQQAKQEIKAKVFKTQEEVQEFKKKSNRIFSNTREVDGKLVLYYSEVGEIGVKSIIWAGQALKFNVPLNAEYQVGRDWAECH